MHNQLKGFCNTPSLFENNFYGFELFELEDIDVDNFDINNIQILQQLPLGKRVEHFFDAIIEQSSDYDRVLKNKQIIHNKHTFGEIDFILFNKKTNTYEHVEMQYKFYVYDDTIKEEIHRYVGPNRSDTMYLKLEKLKNKQLPLLFNEVTKAYLEGIDLDNIKQKISFKGNIFLPRHLKGKSVPLINNACICGYYLSFKEFCEDKSFNKLELFVPHRFDWLSDPALNQTWKSYDEVQEEIAFFANMKASPLIWSKSTQNGKIIMERFFITWW
jgi:hypothetical protein